MRTPSYLFRKPWPDEILDGVGSGFCFGIVSGSAFHFLKGLYNSPNGERLVGTAQKVRMNAPRVGCNIAVWAGLLCVFERSMVYVRQKDDPWNSIFAGTASCGFLKMRQGAGLAARSALLGGVIFALLEGFMIASERFITLPDAEHTAFTKDPHAVVPASVAAVAGTTGIPTTGHLLQGSTVEDSGAPSTSSGFGRIVGRKRQDATSGGRGSTTEISGNFDSPPIPTFEYK